MDSEQREAFREIGGKLDKVNDTVHKHNVETTKKLVEVEQRARAAHHRVDDHLKDHRDGRKWWTALWGGVVIAVVTGIFGLIYAVMTGEGPPTP